MAVAGAGALNVSGKSKLSAEHMYTVDIAELLRAEPTLRGFARALGSHCIDHEGAINSLRDRYGHTPDLSVELDGALQSLGESFWREVARGARTLAEAFAVEPVEVILNVAATERGLLPWILLRGLCVTGLRVWFETTREIITLERGDPFPLVVGPHLPELGELTPHPEWTLAYNDLLHGTGFKLHERSGGAAIAVQLDYSRREIIDAAIWGDTSASIPRIASIHPYDAFDGEFEIRTIKPEWWFDVAPITFDAEGILDALRRLSRRADIVLIPELSLPSPRALAEGIRTSAADLPPLIVAGSAHARDASSTGAERRVNACEVYWQGSRILCHHKAHPAQFRIGSSKRPEGLTHEVKPLRIMSGDDTRVGVVICADLNDDRVPKLLQEAYVTVLLVPAMTAGAGAFVGALADQASQCQGLSVIVNGSPPLDGDGKGNRNTLGDNPSDPFMIMLGLPRSSQQVTVIGPPEHLGRRVIGEINLLSGTVAWEAFS